LEATRRESQAQINVFAGRVGELQTEILRLNALGGRLVEMTGLDAEEFDFENSPPLGGPADARATDEIDLLKLLREMTGLPDLINDCRHKLKQLERIIYGEGSRETRYPLRVAGSLRLHHLRVRISHASDSQEVPPPQWR